MGEVKAYLHVVYAGFGDASVLEFQSGVYCKNESLFLISLEAVGERAVNVFSHRLAQGPCLALFQFHAW